MNNRLFVVSVAACAALAVAGIAAPQAMESLAAFVLGPIFDGAGWFFLASVTIYLVLALALAIGPYGRIRLGDGPPEFSTASWLAMLFCSGMGLGLVFFGAAEPLLHYVSPPLGRGGTPEAARQAIALASVNWGIHAWGVFALGGLAIAYFAFRRGAPYLAGAPIAAGFSGRWAKPVAAAADVLAIIAVVFGVAGSVAMAVLQLDTGLGHVFGIDGSAAWLRIVTLVALVAAYCAAATGLRTGIKWTSNVNAVLAIALLLGVLLVGPTGELAGRVVDALADYPALAFRLSARLPPFDEVTAWMKPWTLTYLIWFIAWTPFVAVFMARISRGRTIRGFVLGVIGMPALACTLWFAVVGGSALHAEMGGAGLAAATQADITVATFALDARLPLARLFDLVSLLLLMLFSITSFDSAAYVLGMLTSGGDLDPPVRRRVVWGVSVGLLGGTLLFAGRMEVLRAVAIAGALPFTFVLLLYGVALLRAIRRDPRP